MPITEKDYVIPPRFTLPIRQEPVPFVSFDVVVPENYSRSQEETQPLAAPKIKQKRQWNWEDILRTLAHEVFYAICAVFLGILAYWYIDSFTYRIVAFACIIILWSNFASSGVRKKAQKAITLLTTMNLKVVRQKKKKVMRDTGRMERFKSLELSKDTTGYLVALKETFLDHTSKQKTSKVRAQGLPMKTNRNRGFLSD